MTQTRLLAVDDNGNPAPLKRTGAQLNMFQRKSKAKNNSSVTANVAGMVANSAKTLMGYSVGETASSAGAVEIGIVDGASAAGNPRLATIDVAASGSETRWFGPNGVDVTNNNLSIDHVQGEANVTLYYSDS